MRKIAILTGGVGKGADRLVSLFNDGNRFRVELIVADTTNTEIADRFVGKDVEVVFLPRGRWETAPEDVVELLEEHEVELLVLEEFNDSLPEAVSQKFEGRIVEISSEENAPREIVAAFENIDSGLAAGQTVAEQNVPPVPKSVDEEWAEKLHLNYDASRLRTTPPPVPGSDAPGNPQYGATQNPAMGNQSGNQINNGGLQFGGGMQSVNGQRYGSGMPSGGRMQNGGDDSGEIPSTYIVWAVIMTIFCCTIPGIVAIVYSSKVSSRLSIGDLEGARRASQTTQIWIIVSFVLGVLSATLYSPLMMIS